MEYGAVAFKRYLFNLEFATPRRSNRRKEEACFVLEIVVRHEELDASELSVAALRHCRRKDPGFYSLQRCWNGIQHISIDVKSCTK